MVHEVGQLWMKRRSITEIAAHLSMKRTEAKRLVDEWHTWMRRMAESDQSIRDRMLNVLFEVDQHWAMVIKEAWATAEQADDAGQLGTKVSALKLVAAVQKDRINTFQQAGINEDTELIAEMQRTQEDNETIKNILREVADEHPEVKKLILQKLSALSDQAEVVEIETAGELES